MISEFQGEYRWLSNFWPARVVLDGFPYPTVEHAYVAAKTVDLSARAAVREAVTPGDAKRFGRTVPLRPGWDDMKLYIMENLLRQKFEIPSLRSLLIETGDTELVEGNRWNDTFWGVCRGKGENHLGKLLMKIRSELRA